MAFRCHLPLCDSRAYSYLVYIYIYELMHCKSAMLWTIRYAIIVYVQGWRLY